MQLLVFENLLAIVASWDAKIGGPVVKGLGNSSTTFNKDFCRIFNVSDDTFDEWIRVMKVSVVHNRIKSATLECLAAWCVQRAWRRAVSNPSYGICRRRIAREFEEMSLESL